MMTGLVRIIERLNLAHPESFTGGSFPEILALLSLVFGGGFLLFAWKHHRYYLGVTGLLVGGWLGLVLKSQIAAVGSIAPFLYLGVCAVAGAFIAVQFQKLVGILMGGFSVTVIASVLFPSVFRPGEHGLLSVSAAFLMGGGLGALFPKFFFVLNSSLIGSVFVTYGVSVGILSSIVGTLTPHSRALIHLMLFLPLLIFGVLYQMISSQRDELPPVAIPPSPTQ